MKILLRLSFLIFLFFSQPSFAGPSEKRYLAAGHPDTISILGPPPSVGSAEAAADLASIQAVVKYRTWEQVELAEHDAGLSFTLFAPAISPNFDLEHLPVTHQFLKKVRREIHDAIFAPKQFYHRTRPYITDTNLVFGEPEPSFSYPSGHAACGIIYAMVLSELYPGKREDLLKIGEQLGWDRVVLGKHYPTDIRAGRVVGYAIVRELDANAAYQDDLQEAREEIAAAHSNPTHEMAK